MAKAPDWLLNAVNSAPNLVEDSPQFRSREADTQLSNLTKASNEALGLVKQETNDARMQTIRNSARALQAITPNPSPLTDGGPQFFPNFAPDHDTPMTPNVPGPADFGASDLPQPLAGPPEQGDAPQAPPDPASEIQMIAQATGLPPQVIASMAMMGEDIQKNEQAMGPSAPAGTVDAPPAPYPAAPGAPAGNMDAPSAPPPPQPLMQPPMQPPAQPPLS